MAIKHRKLFPTTNQTLDCQDICDPSCPYACFPDPDFYFSPPPPVTATPSTSHSGVQLSPYVIALITFTAAFILVVSYYVVVKVCWRRRRLTPPLAGGEDFLDENRGPVIDNPIWYINTVGLQPSVINSITAVKYLKGGGLIEGTDCSVCLNEFQENETLRLLPKCSHAFHIVCIDTWLRSHTNCPMCRCGVLSNTLNEPPPPPVSDSIDSGSNQETLMEIQEFQEPSDELIANPSLRRDEFGEADDEMQIHRIKRSLSINLPINVHHSPVNSRLCRMMSASSISRSLHKRPVPMKRSFSYHGRSILSRYYRNHKAVIWLSNFC